MPDASLIALTFSEIQISEPSLRRTSDSKPMRTSLAAISVMKASRRCGSTYHSAMASGRIWWTSRGSLKPSILAKAGLTFRKPPEGTDS